MYNPLGRLVLSMNQISRYRERKSSWKREGVIKQYKMGIIINGNVSQEIDRPIRLSKAVLKSDILVQIQ